MLPLAILREPEIDTAMAWIEPARGDNLSTSEEVHALGSMRMGIAKERGLPTTE